jgi:outer membrane protein TolC
VAELSYGVRTAAAELEQARGLEDASMRTLQTQSERYRRGEASIVELLDAQSEERDARVGRIRAELAHDLSRLRLLVLLDLGGRLEG